jgi:2-polyprenyl-3-methyl-5-hydroxy-6-metoxy-1,4-benzoquinol methylase
MAETIHQSVAGKEERLLSPNPRDEEKFACILCAAADHRPTSVALRDDPTGKYGITRCESCGHLQQWPLPDPREEKEFYDADRQRPTLEGSDFDYARMKQLCDADTSRRADWIAASVTARSRTLDVGCGYGFLVDELQSFGFVAVGIDISESRIALAQAHSRGRFERSFVQDINESYEGVGLFHVLEHVRDPRAFLAACGRILDPGGRIFVEVPNVDDRLLLESVDYGAFYWQRAHLSYFDADNLRDLVESAGFTDVVVDGVQRYGLRNYLRWIDHGTPQLADPDYGQEGFGSWIEEIYKQNRRQEMTCDTLILTARIGNQAGGGAIS